MFTALIADDESNVCQLILKLGAWEELGIKVVRTVLNGRQAYEQILELRPDIVLTDIRMPLCDGLELISKTRAEGIDSAFIIISGYKHFEYAHSAMRYGVVDYLLKPINGKQLNEALKKACAGISKKERMQAENKMLHHYREETVSRQQEAFWHNVFHNDPYAASPDDLAVWELMYSTYCVMQIRTNLYTLHAPDSMFGDKAKADFAQSMAGIPHQALWHQHPDGHFLLVNFDADSLAEVRQAIHRVFSEIKNLTEVYGDFELVIGCSAPFEGLEQAHVALRQARLATAARYVLFGDKVLEFEQLPDFQVFAFRDFVDEKTEKQIAAAAGILDAYALDKALAVAQQNAVRLRSRAPGDIEDALSGLIRLIAQSLPKHNILHEQMVEEMCGDIFACNTFDGAVGRIRRKAGELTGRIQESYLQEEIRPVRLVKEYIAQHYASPVTLEQLADVVELSAVYLGKLFYQHTGMRFNDYLAQQRIEKAKELLRGTNMTMRELASAVGFSDEKYFSKVFRKLTGVRPSDYRKLYG